MMDIIGQEKLLKKIQGISLDNFPRTLMLEGPKGSGKHIIVDLIRQKLNLPLYNITKNISLDTITEICLKVEPSIYMIEGNNLTEKTENVILKFLEEPLKNSFIILLVDDKASLLETVINRCQVWKMEAYSKYDLGKFAEQNSITDVDKVLQVASTPGQVLQFKDINIDDVYMLCDNIYSKIHRAALPNTLTLTDKVSFKGEDNKIDFDLFMCILLDACVGRVKEDIEGSYEAYCITKRYSTYRNIRNLDKKYLFESFLIDLRDEMQRLWMSKN